MGQACKRWILAGAVDCALAGLVLMATNPVEHHEPSPRPVKEQRRRAVRRATLPAASPTEVYDPADGLPAPSPAAPPDDEPWLGDQPPQPAAAYDEAWFGDEQPLPAFALALASPPA